MLRNVDLRPLEAAGEVNVDRLRFRVKVEHLPATFPVAVARLLDSTKRQVRLGSNGGAVDVRDAGFEVSHCPEGHVNVAGVDARREAVASPVCDCYSLLIGSDTKYREDRAKYLFLRNAHFRLDPNKQGGLEEKALIQPGTCRTLSSKHELGTFGFANFDVMDNFFHCLLVDEGSHVDPFVIPVTQLELRS